MYKVDRFEVRDLALLVPMLESHPFATVTSVAEGRPFVNHLPISTRQLSDGRLQLVGHMSRKNPQWRQFKNGSPVVIAFQGPNAYVNPSWYVEHDVPTWNYIAVQATGLATVVETPEPLTDILRLTVDHMNRRHVDQWEFRLPDDLKNDADLVQAIVGFEMIPDEIVGKFKLSQNRSRADQEGVMSGLKRRGDAASDQVLIAMAESCKAP